MDTRDQSNIRVLWVVPFAICHSNLPETKILIYYWRFEVKQTRHRSSFEKMDEEAPCPMCGKSFPIELLPEHADRCIAESEKAVRVRILKS